MYRFSRKFWFALLALCFTNCIHAAAWNAALHAEKTGFQETGRYEEVERICAALARQYPTWVRCESVGSSSEGRIIRAIVVNRSGVSGNANRPAGTIRKSSVVLVIGGTHAGEIDGKDAGLILLRELLASKAHDNPLNKLVMVFVPVFNVDGHENRGRFLRPNQNGPLEQGERTTARRINLNRDWMLAQSPEMQSMLALVRRWDPLLTVDLHVTDGLRYRHDVALSMSPMFGIDPDLKHQSEVLQQDVIAQLRRKGHQPLDFYPTLNDPDNPDAGVIQDADAPRFSHVYAVLRNRIGLLVEDYAWNDYKSRIEVCKNTLDAVLRSVASRGQSLLNLTQQADSKSFQLGGRQVALDWRNTLETGPAHASEQVYLQGYQYTLHEDAPVVGGRQVSYDMSQPEVWQVPLFKNIRPSAEAMVSLPQQGYLIPVAWASVVRPYLQLHGLDFKPIKRPLRSVSVETMRVREQDVRLGAQSFQGRQRTYVTGQWKPESVDVLPGALFVPIQQRNSLLAAHLLEPAAPDSLSSWGLFNTAYEISDYIASHRELELARWMYEGHEKIRALYGDVLFHQLPNLKQEFDSRLATDEKFKNDPQARLGYWMAQLPPYDPHLNRYPIFRTHLKIP